MFCTINNLLCRHFREEQKNLDKQNSNKIGVLLTFTEEIKKMRKVAISGDKVDNSCCFYKGGGVAKSKPWLAAKQSTNYQMLPS